MSVPHTVFSTGAMRRHGVGNILAELVMELSFDRLTDIEMYNEVASQGGIV